MAIPTTINYLSKLGHIAWDKVVTPNLYSPCST